MDVVNLSLYTIPSHRLHADQLRMVSIAMRGSQHNALAVLNGSVEHRL